MTSGRKTDRSPCAIHFSGNTSPTANIHLGVCDSGRNTPEMNVATMKIGAVIGVAAAELQARAGHASQTAMAIYQHAALDRDKSLAEKIVATYEAWRESRP